MALYREWEPAEKACAAIWRIEEEEAFFQEPAGSKPSIRHPRKRLEHLCGRWLLRRLREDFPLQFIAPDAQDKPRLPENQYFFSISHSFPYVAAVISERDECGIDIQVWHERMDQLAPMFLSGAEQDLLRQLELPASHAESEPPEGQLLTLAWCAKEAAYKWNGSRGIDFIRQLPIRNAVGVSPELNGSEGLRRFELEMEVLRESVSLPAWLERDFACACLLRPKG